MLHIHEHGSRAAVFQEFQNLVVVKRCIERDRDATRGDDTQIGGDPAWMIVGEDRQPGTWWNVVLGNPAADRFSPAVKLAIGTAFEMIVTLEFESDVVRRAFGALQKRS